MTVKQAISASARYRLTIIRNVLMAMDRWGSEWKRNVLTRQMARIPRKAVWRRTGGSTLTRGESFGSAFPPPGPLGIRSGRLSRTVRTDPARFIAPNRFRKALRAGDATVRYARIHEYGGRTGAGHRSYIPKRPYMRPAFEETTRRLNQMVLDATRAAGREAYGR